MDTVCNCEECTLCMACVNSCPRNALHTEWDENGYEKIVIDKSRCVNCGICQKVCSLRGEVGRHNPDVCLAAQANNVDALKKSASGGAFQMLAELVLARDGICYGCELTLEGVGFVARHVRIDKREQLDRVLNSKYIPSIVGTTFREAEADLKAGRTVLFSGTPCQIQGLYAYLGRSYENLITADLICHGITSAKLFNDYICCIEQRDDIKIVDYQFRDKNISWGTNYCYRYYFKKDSRKRIHCRHCPREESSYMSHYLRGDFFREACYTCTLASSERVSDFTLGDYWEIEREHPEFITEKKPGMVIRNGISCILVNTERAQRYAVELNNKMQMHEVALDSILLHNGNLRKASDRGKARDHILDVYRTEGYGPIENRYSEAIKHRLILYRIKNVLKSFLPDRLRILIYRSPILSRIVFH